MVKLVSQDVLLRLNRESDIYKQLQACVQGEIKPSEPLKRPKERAPKLTSRYSDHPVLHRLIIQARSGDATCRGDRQDF